MAHKDVQFIVGFGLLMVILLGMIMLAPHPSLPERSSYLTEEHEIDELRNGKVVLILFYDLESPLSKDQGDIVKGLENELDFLVVQWINVDEHHGDLRVDELYNHYNIDVTPTIILKSLHHETKLIGFTKRTPLLVEINKLKLGG